MRKYLQKASIFIAFLSLSTAISAQESAQRFRTDGVYLGAYTGTWFGVGNSSILGNPVMGGILLELKSGRSGLALNFDFQGSVVKTQPIAVRNNETTYQKDSYGGVQMSLQYSHELYTKNRLALEAVGGFGFGEISFTIPDTEDSESKSSFFVDPGVGVRYFIGQKTFLQFKAQYNLANYKLKDNLSTNIGGNFITTKLALGWR